MIFSGFPLRLCGSVALWQIVVEQIEIVVEQIERMLPMRFPMRLNYDLTKYIIGNKLNKVEKFPLVLMLEPTHLCNLACSGCGRIREYADTIQEMMTPGGVPQIGGRMSRAGRYHHRRRAVPLPPHLDLVRRRAEPGQAHLLLHQRRCCWKRRWTA